MSNTNLQNESLTFHSHTTRYLNFSLALEEFAIPLLSVKEVIALPEITPIPYSPPYFLGIMNLRGSVISIIDLRVKFHVKNENNSETAVIICDLGQLSLGIVVNSVNSVLSLSQDDIKPRPEFEQNQDGNHPISNEYIIGVTKKDKRLILLIDLEKVLNVEDFVKIKKIHA